MKLATFNMRNGGSRLHWATLVRHTLPTFCCVQETRDPASFAPDLLDDLELGTALWRPVEHGRWGSALFASGGQISPLTLRSFCGWVVGAHVRYQHLEFLAFSVHLPPTRSSYVRSAHLLLDELGSVARGLPLVLAGDWNLTVSPRTSADPLSLRRGEIELLERLSDEFGVTSAWSAARPDDVLPQTLRWTVHPAHPYHCDGIFIPTGWTAALRDVRVASGDPWLPLSDHNPVVVDLDVATLGFDAA